MHKILIVGSFDFTDKSLLDREIRRIVWTCGGQDNVELVTDNSPGASALAREHAREHCMQYKVFSNVDGNMAVNDARMRTYCLDYGYSVIQPICVVFLKGDGARLQKFIDAAKDTRFIIEHISC